MRAAATGSAGRPIHLSSRFGRSPVQAPATVTTSFGELLAAAADGARQLDGDGVLSLALPLPARDPLALLSHLEESDRFRFLWDGAPGLCLAASGRTNSLELSGPRRFELAQRFASACLSRLATPESGPPLARPRVLLAFGFFEAPLQPGPTALPGVQAVLPRWPHVRRWTSWSTTPVGRRRATSAIGTATPGSRQWTPTC